MQLRSFISTMTHVLEPVVQKKLRYFMCSLVFVLCVTLLLSIFRSDRMLWLQALTYPALQLSVKPTVSQDPTVGNTVLKGDPAHLLRVNGSRTFLMSAYLEHRTTVKEVRVIAIKLRSERVALQCSLCCQDQLHVSTAVINIHRDHFRFPYGTTDILCPLPSGCESPTHVAITSPAIKRAEKSEFEFLEIKNQKARDSSFPHNFTCCFSAMYNFTNVLQLVQSLEMLQLLGVNRVVVYKTNCSADTQRVLEYYSGKGLVEVIPWSLAKYLKVSQKAKPEQDPGDLHYFGQLPALNDCLYRYMYRSKYVALHDLDELILPQSVNSWLELLPLLEKTYGTERCYMFENNWIPNLVGKPTWSHSS
ncbi:uncharacterized protein si:zfos-464b6.2 isoform X2 [Girardinichthys multiradiatus]|uniref:uncharacterized protein si:zfos-464b6.2 isoform X2 n=1 Tax=Girardinichthys multiradiatus TaxID=208333 RepID=UPI001FAC6271|nr:uncharacterized protein si:zfos-464b6.2 isoform X2 [Girardinichthys multiradiatus]